MNKRNRTVSNTAKPKAETYEMWKERKLIEELKCMQLANEADKLKLTLNEKLSEGRKTLNELAVKNWLKKKQESLDAKISTFDNAMSKSSINHVQRNTVKPKVETRLIYPKYLVSPNEENIEIQSTERKEEIQSEKKKKFEDIHDENLNESDQDLVIKEVQSNSISNKSSRSVNSKSIISFDRKQIKLEDDEISQNKNLCKELQKYLENPNAYELSERQTHNKVSFEEWLKKKDTEIREKKERERRLQLIQDNERRRRQEISSQAVNEWYLKNAFRMLANDKFLKNRKAKNKLALYSEILNAQESESVFESLDL
ncbi:hypothetical protein O3M35_008888 [Rhynocoris fuscipes]|uniref:Coiled-coil domain-containing protein n=1 Tax=Rhynocoris fuscipes TaxID=488301 RepID=A0AAW1D7R5_9HEMI